MNDDFLKELDEDFRDDPEYQALSREEKLRIISVLEKMLAMGIGAVYGDEDEGVPDADVPCGKVIQQCKAKCCTFIFALTKDEVKKGLVKHNEAKPFFIARDESDGYCPHLDRQTYACEVWHDRPLRCRRYDCQQDKAVWEHGFPIQVPSR
ncbi:MAG: YkgJ family cysteine cluster protein [Gammaproteobacteria bacterium]|nr:YkgJ family cysteine cluster protein [Gammaproteobacteria bacterium]